MLAAIWGCSFLLIKLSIEGLSPVQVVLGRVIFGTLTLVGIVTARHGRLPRERRTWAHLGVIAVLANLAPFFLFAWGEQRVASSLAGIYNATTPLFTLLVALAALPEERPSRARLGGLLLGFLGVVVVIAPWRSGGASSLPGQAACLTAGACYGVAIVYTRRFLSGRGHPPLILAAGQLLSSAVLLVIAAPLWIRPEPDLSPSVVLSIVVLGAVGTGVAYLIFYGLIGEIGATSASTVTYVVPLVAVALGVVILDERVAWNSFAGAAVVVLGIAVAEGRLRRPARTS